MTILRDHQFEILPTADAAEGVVFGIGSDVNLDQAGFRPGGPEWMTQDAENSRGGTAFGRDEARGSTWAWDLFIDREDEPTALESLAKIRTAWEARQIRRTPRAALAVRYQIADRQRRIYGRPRRFDAPPDNRILGGYIPVGVDFQCVDHLTYDDTLQSITLGLANPSSGGFVFPVNFPVSTLPVGDQQDYALVGGDEPTPVIIRVDGPIVDAFLETDDWRIDLRTTIGDGEYIEIDTRPWAMSVLRNGTANASGALGRRQWLSEVRLAPGTHEFRFGGNSSSGGATAQISWRSAFTSW